MYLPSLQDFSTASIRCPSFLFLSDLPGVVVLHHGAWFDPQNLEEGRIDVHGNSNTLTMDVPTSSLACGNIASTALVEVTKWTKPLPRVSVYEQPPRAA